MVRPRMRAIAVVLSVPHSRGDGPILPPALLLVPRCSPLAWGWSDQHGNIMVLGGVFPTRVGIVRLDFLGLTMLHRVPHSRGDSPSRPDSGSPLCPCSPLAWGWSGSSRLHTSGSRVFPTRVGMVRRRSTASPPPTCVPHSRGDGPGSAGSAGCGPTCSPLAWGWSGRSRGSFLPLFVFPTRVGMVRWCGPGRAPRPSVPHSRGDGPRDAETVERVDGCSPLAWGWSAGRLRASLRADVFPTRVGMVRHGPSCPAPTSCVPHSRGDGPATHPDRPGGDECSPLAWGWSERAAETHRARLVFPTRVGMVRAAGNWPHCRCRVPHSRGDGPWGFYEFSGASACSPLAWGWSARLPVGAVREIVFPTRVGMVRASTPATASRVCVPHSRGDGPPNRSSSSSMRPCSSLHGARIEMTFPIIAALAKVVPQFLGAFRNFPISTRVSIDQESLRFRRQSQTKVARTETPACCPLGTSHKTRSQLERVGRPQMVGAQETKSAIPHLGRRRHLHPCLLQKGQSLPGE